jgi:ABC-type phosphate transport system auxiliary subunit
MSNTTQTLENTTNLNVELKAEALKVAEKKAKADALKLQRITEAEAERIALQFKTKEKAEAKAKVEAEALNKRIEAKAKAEAKQVELNEKLEALKLSAKSSFDFVKLANLSDKIEDKTLSAIFKKVTNSVYASDICGSASAIPKFNEFKAVAPNKVFFSNWDGYLMLRKFNKAEALASKVERQKKAVAKK